MRAADLRLDPLNGNIGSKEGREAITASINRFGYVRPIVVDADLTILAGEHVALANPDAEIEVIDTDGSELVVHQRTDLDDEDEATILAGYADNKLHELNAVYDKPAVVSWYDTHHLTPYYRPEEIDAMRADLAVPSTHPVEEEWQTIEIDATPPVALRWKAALKEREGKGYPGKLARLLDEIEGME